MAKTLEGTVVSTKMMKTVIVMVERVYRHPLYQKVIRRHKKFKAHYEGSDVNVGDTVVIQETRPISKHTHFKILEKKK